MKQTPHSTVMAMVLSRHARRLIPRQIESLKAGFKNQCRLFEFDPNSERSASDLTRLSKEESYRCTLVIGGDGTLNWALNILGTEKPFAVFPAGTANDLATHEKLPRDVEGAVKTVLKGHTTSLDLIEVNGRFFATTGGGDLPATCALSLSNFRNRGVLNVLTVEKLGPLAYEISAAGNILLSSQTPQKIKIAVEPGELESASHDLVAISPGFLVTNQGTFAGRLRVAPKILNDDGKFEIFVLSAGSRSRLLRTLLGLRLNRFAREGDFYVLQTDKAVITCERTSRFFGDGELLAEGRSFCLRIAKGVLKLICRENS